MTLSIQMIRNLLCTALFTTLVTLSSCVDEGDIVFPEEDKETITGESIAIVSFLQALADADRRDHVACFEFVFPVTLQFNSGISIAIDDEEGLLETAKNQSSGLHIDALSFPFLVIRDGTIINIENDRNFNELLESCDIHTFKQDFFTFYPGCIELTFPITMIGHDSAEAVVNNLDELFDFKEKQGDLYQPDFLFPVSGKVLPDSAVIMESHFDFYRIFDQCEICPEIGFRIDEEFAIGKYIFDATFGGDDTVGTWGWYINGDLVKTDGPAVGGDGRLIETFFPGTYEICIKASSDRCELAEFCQILEVPDRCPELFFTAEQEGDLPLFVFTADFEGMNEITYEWKAFSNEDLLFSEAEIPGVGDNKLIADFEPGHYLICIKAELDGCPDVLEFCVEIDVPDRCPELFFEFEQQDSTRNYEFFATFEARQDIEYTWAIYQAEDLIFFETEMMGNADHQLFFQFDPGAYMVCIESETTRCSEVIKFCREFLIE